MAAYNGYPSWNAWNVSLWINNDEGLYRQAVECVKATKTKRAAARKFLAMVQGEKTPDGAVYNMRGVLGALADY